MSRCLLVHSLEPRAKARRVFSLGLAQNYAIILHGNFSKEFKHQI